MPKVVPFQRPSGTKAPRKRKSPDEWRLMRYASKVKDGRPVMLAFPDPRKEGGYIVQQAYWHQASRAWFLANTRPEDGFDAAADLLGKPEQWMPVEAMKPSAKLASGGEKSTASACASPSKISVRATGRNSRASKTAKTAGNQRFLGVAKLQVKPKSQQAKTASACA